MHDSDAIDLIIGMLFVGFIFVCIFHDWMDTMKVIALTALIFVGMVCAIVLVVWVLVGVVAWLADII